MGVVECCARIWYTIVADRSVCIAYDLRRVDSCMFRRESIHIGGAPGFHWPGSNLVVHPKECYIGYTWSE